MAAITELTQDYALVYKVCKVRKLKAQVFSELIGTFYYWKDRINIAVRTKSPGIFQ